MGLLDMKIQAGIYLKWYLSVVVRVQQTIVTQNLFCAYLSVLFFYSVDINQNVKSWRYLMRLILIKIMIEVMAKSWLLKWIKLPKIKATIPGLNINVYIVNLNYKNILMYFI